MNMQEGTFPQVITMGDVVDSTVMHSAPNRSKMTLYKHFYTIQIITIVSQKHQKSEKISLRVLISCFILV